jgi:hypothetical protein
MNDLTITADAERFARQLLSGSIPRGQIPAVFSSSLGSLAGLVALRLVTERHADAAAIRGEVLAMWRAEVERVLKIAVPYARERERGRRRSLFGRTPADTPEADELERFALDALEEVEKRAREALFIPPESKES